MTAPGPDPPLDESSIALLITLRRTDPEPAVRRAAEVALARLHLDRDAKAAARVLQSSQTLSYQSRTARFVTSSADQVATAGAQTRHLNASTLDPNALSPAVVVALVQRYIATTRLIGLGTMMGVRALLSAIADAPAAIDVDRSLIDIATQLLVPPDGVELPNLPAGVVAFPLIPRIRPASAARVMAWLLAWAISRAGARRLLNELEERLRSANAVDRWAAAVLVACVAILAEQDRPPRGIDQNWYSENLWNDLAKPATPIDPVPAPEQAEPSPATANIDAYSREMDSDDILQRRAYDDILRRRAYLEALMREGSRSLERLDRDVQFTVYRPRAVRSERWHTLLAFVHRSMRFVDADGTEVDPLAEVRRQAQGVLGAQAVNYGSVTQDSAAALPRGGEIVLEPWLEHARINPPRAVLRWEEPVHRLEFRLRVPAHTDGTRLQGGLRVFLGVLVLAELRFVIDAAAAATAAAEAPDMDTPVRAVPYRRIFASYSHQDTEIVTRVRAAAAAVGDSYLIDVDELRAGEQWAPRIATLIASSDVFQLFWSTNSMRSDYVRQEWEYAMGLGRPHFVRPVFWERPRPEDRSAGLPPAILDRLHFWFLSPALAGTPRRLPPAASNEPSSDDTTMGSPRREWPPPQEGWRQGPPAGRPPVQDSQRRTRLLLVLAVVVVLLLVLLRVWQP